MVKKNKSESEKYIKLTQREHCLLRPENYIGSVVSEREELYIVKNNDLSNIEVVKREVLNNQGFVKIYSEILDNASDHYLRGGEVKSIKIDIEDKRIIIKNDGTTIPIQIHDKEKIYIPTLVFLNLLSGSNYDDSEDRSTIGRNGVGSKLTVIFSKKFLIECCDGKKIFKQMATDNLSVIHEPIISKCDPGTKSYTKITYYPDFKKFGIDKITEDLRSVLYKKTLDTAAYIPSVKISLNSKLIPLKSAKDYMLMHISKETDFFYEEMENGWKVGICKSPSHSFEHVSLVNSTNLYKGGTLTNYLALELSKDINNKIKKSIKSSWTDVKNKLFMFIIADIINPSFDSQSKTLLTTSMTNQITGGCKVSENTVKKIMKSDIVQSILDEIELKEKLSLKKIGGGKRNKVNLPKLVDANKAGTRESGRCKLFLTEGDSALGFAIAGMSVIGRDYYGAFPLKGKILNTRDASVQKIKANAEIQSLINIIGLQFGKVYKNTSELRYGKIIITTDSDLDGVHIKGLILNFIEKHWPELLKLDFIEEFITPILKIKKGNKETSFYTIKEYDKWLQKGLKGWDVKYYKGLGTSTAKEAKEYFSKLEEHLLPFVWDTDENHEYIDLVFNKNRADERKKWMIKNDIMDVIKYKTPTPISSFINNEMIGFSLEDNIRSIPDIYDGLKPSHRKIMNTCFKRNIMKDTPVSSLGGSIKETQKYHHGEVSLEQGIINLAQDFVGANNIPLLYPSGNFGSRLQGGKDSASSRYINTYLNGVTKIIFDKRDNNILTYLEEDGVIIEPIHFKPIIPVVLINGTEGIGTGWSTSIPKYNPKDIIRVIENKLSGKKSNRIHPWYRGFIGKFDEVDNGYISYGKFNVVNSTTIHITELPIGVWTQSFTEHLFKLIESKVIKDFKDNSTERTIDIKISINRDCIVNLNTDEKIIKELKLSSRIYTSNMHLFVDGKITKFETVEEIIDVFYNKRLKDYDLRKKSMLNTLNRDKTKLDNQVRFIKEVIKGTLKINNRKKDLITKDLVKGKFDMYEDSYNYLLSMPIYNLTKEKVDELMLFAKNKASEIIDLKRTKPKDLWLKDITELKKHI